MYQAIEPKNNINNKTKWKNKNTRHDKHIMTVCKTPTSDEQCV